MDSLREELMLSVSLRCHRICGPFVIGPSIRINLLTSFSKLKCAISHERSVSADEKKNNDYNFSLLRNVDSMKDYFLRKVR